MAAWSWSGGLAKVVEFLGDPRTRYDGGSTTLTSAPWELTADEYLKFARTDLRQRGARGRVNALGNAKRALHCQVDSVLFATGFWPRAHERRWSFHDKAKLLAEMKIATPNILQRINRLRNRVEHDYSAPEDVDQLENFLDVVELFVSGTRHFVGSRYEEADFSRPIRGGTATAAIKFDGRSITARLWTPNEARTIEASQYPRFRKLQVAVFKAAWRENMTLTL